MGLFDFFSSSDNTSSQSGGYTPPSFLESLAGSTKIGRAMDAYKKNDALSYLAQNLANGGQIDVRSALAQMGAATGDPSALLNYQIAQDKQNADLRQKSALAQLITGQAMPTAGNNSSPLSVRNNNAGNMRGKDGNFQQFATPQAGLEAMQADLTKKISGQSPMMVSKFGQNYKPTLANVISTWAPPTENDTQSYINNVAQATGLSPDQPLSVMDIQKIMPAMIKQEGGQAASKYFDIPPDSAIPLPAGVNPSDVQSRSITYGEPQQQPTPDEPLNSTVQQLRNLATVDPEKYGAAYIAAQQDAIKNKQDQTKIMTDQEHNLRKEFEGLPDVKQYREVESSYKRISKSAKTPSAAGDIALVFNYMKMLDPGSTVREGEFATAQNATGVPTRVLNAYNQAMSGERLAPEQRKDFMNQAKEQYNGAKELFTERADRYEDLAKSYGFDPKNIVEKSRKQDEMIGSENAPPVSGAKQAPDGLWYVQKDGKTYLVNQ